MVGHCHELGKGRVLKDGIVWEAYEGDCPCFGNWGPQTCLPAAHGVAKLAGRTAHLHRQGIQDPREGPSLARRWRKTSSGVA